MSLSASRQCDPSVLTVMVASTPHRPRFRRAAWAAAPQIVIFAGVFGGRPYCRKGRLGGRQPTSAPADSPESRRGIPIHFRAPEEQRVVTATSLHQIADALNARASARHAVAAGMRN